MKMSSSDESNEDVASVLVEDLLPAKSKLRYLHLYDGFLKWKRENNESSFSEKVFLKYFNEVGKTLKPSTLWGIYSMLKSTMRAKHNIYLHDYMNLRAWLRRRSDGFKSSKSEILTEEDIRKFLAEAPDEIFLATKVVLILGVCGELGIHQLMPFKTNNIKTVDGIMIGILTDEQNKTEKVFVIRDEFIPYVTKYQAMRPTDVETDRFFLSFRGGRCTKQVIGRHKMAHFPRDIANYLQLPHPEHYTGHCFRRSGKLLDAAITLDPNKKGHPISAQGEIEDVLEFAKQYKKKQQDKSCENAPDTNEHNPQSEDIEPAFEVPVKTENLYDASDDFFVEAEPFDDTIGDPMKYSDTKEFKMEKPSEKRQFSDVVDVISEDSEEMDIVHIMSEDVSRSTTLQSLREDSEGASSQHDTKVTVAGKNITIIFKNCTNIGNVTVNVINK